MTCFDRSSQKFGVDLIRRSKQRPGLASDTEMGGWGARRPAKAVLEEIFVWEVETTKYGSASSDRFPFFSGRARKCLSSSEQLSTRLSVL